MSTPIKSPHGNITRHEVTEQVHALHTVVREQYLTPLKSAVRTQHEAIQSVGRSLVLLNEGIARLDGELHAARTAFTTFQQQLEQRRWRNRVRRFVRRVIRRAP